LLAQPINSSLEDALTIHEVHAALQPPSSIDLTANPDNLWERMRNGFAMTNLNDDLTCITSSGTRIVPDALRRMVERSRPYLHHIVEELEARGMPTEMALLPMVESSFNPMAYSRSHAPACGNSFRPPASASTWNKTGGGRAARHRRLDRRRARLPANHLRNAWRLASGAGLLQLGRRRGQAAIHQNDTRGLPTDYASLTCRTKPGITSPNFRPEKHFRQPGADGPVRAARNPQPPYFATIDTVHPMDVKTAARLADMPVDQFVALNPSHNRPVIQADSAVVIPADKLDTFRSNLEKNAAPLTEWQSYTLKHGEKLQTVAPVSASRCLNYCASTA
jgi:membrane-bound lytic murein transglycosylase D